MSLFGPKNEKSWADDIYPDQRPGSRYCDEADQRAILNQKKIEQRRAERLKADPDAWENMPEAWEAGELEQFECGNCGRTGDQTEIIEATRRCGTGYGEWYCAPGFGCQAEK